MSWVGYVVLVTVALMVAFTLWTGLSARGVRGRSVEGLHEALPGLHARQAKAVIYCYSEHCGPCRRMAPEIDRLQQQHPNLFKLDVARHPREARALGVRVTPTTLLVEDARVLKGLLGAGAVPSIEVFLRQG